MRLTLLDDRDDLPSARTFAICEAGVLWQQFENGSWGRGCLAGADALVGEPLGARPRFVFLRPAWTHGYTPLTLEDFRRASAPSTERNAA